MTDYIKREDVIGLTEDVVVPYGKKIGNHTTNPIVVWRCIDPDKVMELPSADVRENVKSEWQPIEVQPYFKKHFDTSVVCSVCHRKGNKRWNFCPNCGAQMMMAEE